MRRNITISLDQRFIELMDARRGSMPRSRWLEAAADPQGSAPTYEHSSAPATIVAELSGELAPDEPPPLDKWGEPAGTVYDETDPRSWT